MLGDIASQDLLDFFIEGRQVILQHAATTTATRPRAAAAPWPRASAVREARRGQLALVIVPRHQQLAGGADDAAALGDGAGAPHQVLRPRAGAAQAADGAGAAAGAARAAAAADALAERIRARVWRCAAVRIRTGFEGVSVRGCKVVRGEVQAHFVR